MIEKHGNFEQFSLKDDERSRELLAFHVQCIVSVAIVKHVWSPFASEYTARNEVCRHTFEKISQTLKGPNQPEARIHHIWAALTMKSIRELPPDLGAGNEEHGHGTASLRAQNVIQELLPVLELPLNPQDPDNKAEELKRDLLSICEKAIQVWDKTRDHEVEISATLEPPHPKLPPSIEEELGEASGKTRDPPAGKYLTLFPAIKAKVVFDTAEREAGTNVTKVPAETYINDGAGLPESCGLVNWGKSMKRDDEAFLSGFWEKIYHLE